MRPDMIAVAKALSYSYFPISATLSSDEMYQVLADNHKGAVFCHGFTNSRHPVGAANRQQNWVTRVSTLDQDLELQVAALKAGGCNIIRSETRSGTSTAGREELRSLLDFVRPRDTFVVTRIDRLARSIGDLQDIVRELRRKGATLKATEQPIDTSTADGKAFLDMLGVFAEFETNLRRERQMEGISAAKARGVSVLRT
jgi:hypothetical protein